MQIASACWELYCLEHGIQPDGILYRGQNGCPIDDSYNAFFGITPAGQCVPRAILIDLEPTVIGKI